MGLGCQPDPVEAHNWYMRAANQGDERAEQRMATIQAENSVDKRKGKRPGMLVVISRVFC